MRNNRIIDAKCHYPAQVSLVFVQTWFNSVKLIMKQAQFNYKKLLSVTYSEVRIWFNIWHMFEPNPNILLFCRCLFYNKHAVASVKFEARDYYK